MQLFDSQTHASLKPFPNLVSLTRLSLYPLSQIFSLLVSSMVVLLLRFCCTRQPIRSRLTELPVELVASRSQFDKIKSKCLAIFVNFLRSSLGHQVEVEIISRVHHKDLVSLVGYCITGSKRMLVYEFLPNNTLEFHLHGFSKTYYRFWA